jgi:hypothetical protein
MGLLLLLLLTVHSERIEAALTAMPDSYEQTSREHSFDTHSGTIPQGLGQWVAGPYSHTAAVTR